MGRTQLRYIVVTNTYYQSLKLVERNLRSTLSLLPAPHKVILLDQNPYPLNLHVKYKKNSILQHKMVDSISISATRNSLKPSDDIDWIVFCDDDVYFQKDYAKRLASFSVENPKVEIIAGSSLWDDDMSFCSFRQKRGGDLNKFKNSKLYTRSNFAIKASAYVKLEGFDERFGVGSYWEGGEDTDFIWKAFFSKTPMAYHRDMIVFRGRQNNLSFTTRMKTAFRHGVGNGGPVGKWLIEKKKLIVLYECAEMMILPLLKMLYAVFSFEPKEFLLQIPIILGRPWGLAKYIMISSLNFFRKKISPRFFSSREKNEKLKILMISLQANTGGYTHLINLVEEMKKQNNIIYIASPLSKSFRRQLQKSVDGFYPLKNRRFSFITLIRLLSYCRSRNIDIIHSHGRGAGLYGRLLALFWGKSIHTFHGVYAGPGFINSLKIIFDKFLKYSTDHFVCISHDERKKALQNRVIMAEKSSVIHNGVNVEQIQEDFNKYTKKEARQKYHLPLDRKIWGTLTKLHYQKGLDLFLQEIRKFPMEEILFAIAGDGNDKKKLKEMVNKYKLQKKVFFLGEVDTPIMFLKALDGYFSYSRWEGLPTGVLEAMASALPCVIPKVPGHNDLINLDAVDFFYPENPGDFRFTLEDVAPQAPPEPKGLNWAKKEFSSAKMAVKTEHLYSQMR